MKPPNLAFVFAVLFAIAFTSVGRAQQQAQPAREATEILRGLESESTRAQAVEKLKGTSQASAAFFVETALDDATPTSVRTAINENLPGIFTRLRAQRAEQNATAEKAWRKTRLVDVYRKGSGANAAWDKEAIAALECDCDDAASFELLQKAIDAGCKDPVIAMLHLIEGINLQRFERDKAVTPNSGMNDLKASDYSDGVKFWVRLRFAGMWIGTNRPAALTTSSKPETEWPKLLALFPMYAAESPGQMSLQEAVLELNRVGQKSGDHRAQFGLLHGMVTEALKDSAIPYTLACSFYVDWAWDARGGGVANTVTAEGWKLFAERLRLAKQAGIEAWRLDPLDDHAAATMITVAMGQNADDAMMEKWFRLAMMANPDSKLACDKKAYYLSPQWHGGVADALKFGRECVRIGTARNRIPTVLVDVIYNAGTISGNLDSFVTRPEIWQDYQAVYGKMLGDRTRLIDDKQMYLYDRANYIRWAYLCRQWQALLDLATEFGDEIDMKQLGGKDRYAFFKKLAAEELAKKSP